MATDVYQSPWKRIHWIVALAVLVGVCIVVALVAAHVNLYQLVQPLIEKIAYQSRRPIQQAIISRHPIMTHHPVQQALQSRRPILQAFGGMLQSRHP